MAAHGESKSLSNRLLVKEGILAGAVSFVCGLAATGLLLQLDSNWRLGGGIERIGEDIGRVFFSSHYFVDIQTPQGDLNYITDLDPGPDISVAVYFLIPVILLIAGGYLLAKGARAADPEGAVLAGASVAIGYLPLVLVGTQVFSGESFGETVEPVFVDSLLFAGILYPVLFGAVGGYLWFSREN